MANSQPPGGAGDSAGLDGQAEEKRRAGQAQKLGAVFFVAVFDDQAGVASGSAGILPACGRDARVPGGNADRATRQLRAAVAGGNQSGAAGIDRILGG